MADQRDTARTRLLRRLPKRYAEQQPTTRSNGRTPEQTDTNGLRIDYEQNQGWKDDANEAQRMLVEFRRRICGDKRDPEEKPFNSISGNEPSDDGTAHGLEEHSLVRVCSLKPDEKGHRRRISTRCQHRPLPRTQYDRTKRTPF